MAGSIEKRGKNSYRLVCLAGYDLQGRPIKKTKTIHGTKKDAEIELAKFVADVQKGMYVEGKSLKFTDFVEIWKRDYGSKELAPSTYKRYLGILESRIIPFFGHFRVDKIKPTDIMQFYDLLSKDTQIVRRKDNNGKKTGKPLSPKTILEHHRLLRAMLQKAVYWQMIPYNPASRVRPPKAKKPNINFYDDAQTIALIKALEGEELKFRVIILLTIFTGLRRGEVLGLEWQDINFKNSSLTVRQASQYVSSIGIYTKDPKTETSNRIISIPESIIKLLKEYKREQLKNRLRLGDKWIETDRLFVQWNGAPMHPDTITRWFRQFLEDKNLPHITFHGLRHTHATLLISQGLDVRTVSNRLGHAQTSTTLNFYAHAFAKMDREASDKLDNLLYREDTKKYFKAN